MDWNSLWSWYSNVPPAQWLWWSIFLSIIAVVVTMMAGVFPMFFGKPKIKISFEKTLGYKLTCWIKRVPPSRLLSQIGVDRRILDVDCDTTILDMSGNIIEYTTYPTASSKNLRIHIVEIKNRVPGQVFLKDQTNGYGRMLDTGSYILELEIWDAKDNVQIQKTQKHFRVNPTNPFVEWIDKGQNAKA